MSSMIAINYVQPWILDSGDIYHVCNTLHGMKVDINLKPGQLCVRMENGSHASVHAIGTHILGLPNVKTLQLKECYFIPTCIYIFCKKVSII